MLTVAVGLDDASAVAGVAGLLSVLLLIMALITKDLVVVLRHDRALRLNRALDAMIGPLLVAVAGAAAARFW